MGNVDLVDKAVQEIGRVQREIFGEALDKLAERYLKTLDNGDEVEMYLTPQEYAEIVLCLGGGWYKQPGFIEWVKREVLSDG